MILAIEWWGWLLIAFCSLGLAVICVAGIYYPFHDKRVKHDPDSNGDQGFPGPPA